MNGKELGFASFIRHSEFEFRHFFQWVGRRSNPRLLVFSQALSRLSYRPD